MEIKPKTLTVLTQSVLLVLLLITSAVTIFMKANFHVDEITSYGIANHKRESGIHMPVEKGKKYIPAEEPFLNFLTVSDKHRFDYASVYQNTARDVHPPLYLYILHTVCSFFPGSFKKWYAGVINIVFAAGILVLVHKTSVILTKSKKISLIVSLIFVLSGGILNAVSFFRMYVMAMFFCSLSAYVLVKAIENDHASGFRFYLVTFLSSLLGALTHYFCIIFSVVICAVYCVILCLHRKYKQILFMITVGCVSGGSAVLLFRPMISHMFFGNRGKEAQNNLRAPFSEFLKRFVSFSEFVNTELFGGMLIFLLCTTAACILILFAEKKTGCFRNSYDIVSPVPIRKLIEKYSILLISSFIYFLFICKAAAYVDSRYLYPSYAVILCGSFCFLFSVVDKLPFKRISIVLQILLAAVIILFGLFHNNWKYLYRYTIPGLEESKKYSDVDCLIVYNQIWRTNVSFMELKNYKSATFISEKMIDTLKTSDLAAQKKLILMLPNSSPDLLNIIHDNYLNFTDSKTIIKFKYNTSYYLTFE